MFYTFFVLLVVLKTVSSQINGEFWWLNEKLTQLQHVEPPAPQFEDISEFETDESVKIIFKDNEMLPGGLNENQELSLNEGEIPPGFIYFDLAKPELVDKEIVIDKKKLTNKTDEDIKINFSSSNKQMPADIQSSSSHRSNSTKNIKKYLLKHPSPIFYKLAKPVAIKNNALSNNNKIFFAQNEEEENIKQFVLPDLNTDFKKRNKTKNNGDEFKFVFPGDNGDFWNRKPLSEGNENSILNSTNTISDLNTSESLNKISMVNKTVYSGKIAISDKIAFDEDKPTIETESICTFITKHECLHNKGTIHMTGLCPMNSFHDFHRICCILPLSSHSKYKGNRYKRSDKADISQALKQRNALLQRKNFSQTLKNNQDDTTTNSNPQKIVTPGDYVDPYWNVKNFKFRQQTQFNANKDYENTKYDSSNKDYSVDYTVEVPKPGLLGLHSEQEERLTTWKMRNKGYSYDGYDEVSEEDSGESDVPFGYGMFDPRQGNRKKNARSKKRKPQRLMVTSAEENKGSESQTINFHSSPDFHVLHGFKLVNLSGNKNRFVRTTTETLCDNQDTSNENTFSEVENPDDIYDDTIDLDQQVYKDCGITLTSSLDGNFKEAPEETNPWLALVVLTKSPQTILCYATIVHPRAVITAAECVHGKIPGDVTVLTGLWNLRKDKAKPQNRMASVYIQAGFKLGELANDLALLYWKRPFVLEANIQPVCLSDPHVGDDCYFVGWGGYDQALRHQPNSQQATILTPRACNEKLSSPELVLPPGAFCASVESRGTVTGIGGPLLCKAGSRVSVVGVAVYRENVVILLPTFEWVASALRDHQII